MPWYKVPLAVYVEAEGPAQAQDAVLAAYPGPAGSPPWASASWPVELSEEQVGWWRRLDVILAQARQDSEEGNMVSDGRYPGVRFTPAAAAELAALEFEAQQPDE